MAQVIVFENDNGGVAVCIPTGELPIETVLSKDVPANRGARIVAQSELPNDDNDFFDAWQMDSKSVSVNMDKAKLIGHSRRHEARDILFAPYDKIINLQIPGMEEQRAEAEAQRVLIREKDAACQAAIEAASTTQEIRDALSAL